MAKRDKNWLQRQQRDTYVKQARESHYRSRAVYKLMEIDKRDRLFIKAGTVVDVGSSPGSWSQYAAEKTGSKGRIVAVDILPMTPVKNVEPKYTIKPEKSDNALTAMNVPIPEIRIASIKYTGLLLTGCSF